MSEKTEQATPQKLQEARKKGQVGQSQDVPKLLICAGLLETIFALAGDGMQRLQSIFSQSVININEPFFTAIKDVFLSSLWCLAYFSAVTSSVVVIMRILGGWIQFGPLFAIESISFKFDALNPAGHLKNMFSAKQLTSLFLNIFKAAVIFVVFYFSLESELSSFIQLASVQDLNQFCIAVLSLLIKLTRTTLGILILLSIIDFALQKFYHLKQQRMSHEDIRNEHKQNEGDPHMKGHRRQKAHEILNEDPKPQRVVNTEDADMILVNPTHYAIGLYYRNGVTPLPLMLFKSEGYEAKEIIAEAQSKGVPVVRFIWLTRTLYHSVQEGAYISRETLKAVAQVYRVLREFEEHYIGEIIEMDE
ncbi:type III secretion system export apparatus subunit SctU [Pantoea ananatis]|uniref:type III secretion system export apparatus subunit SctU n=1 Tax=Pantoea ananas TaxID=553 RepID=UPI00188ECD38|nr:type III secretion system export apparatus subunit SctU [Pantoea ananatis]